LPAELSAESIGQVAEGWLNDNVESAKAWFAQLPPEMRDLTIMRICGEKSHQVAPASVIDLVFTVRDKEFRDKALTEFARTYSSDRDEAFNALNDFANTDEQKAYLSRLIMEKANGL
jgi:hypothetical protein